MIALIPLLLLAAPTPERPPANAEEEAVMAPVERLLGAIATRDAAAMLQAGRSDGKLTGVTERPDGTRSIRSLTLAEFSQLIASGKERVEERSGLPSIKVDGDVAMVWARYTFFLEGKIRHCGVNHFDLVREAGTWKILNITWSQRTTGCEGWV
ncbi:nuclear transport factor 2 family protein [Sphingomonas sp.]|uniref:nuclear transport factor 2 family protein n=1 Tax=Sphingomonas sp. TaxID=28214 RepID=UPI0031D0C07A